MKTQLSVVMPCLNEADTLEVCLRKAFRGIANSGVEGEVIVADNGSTDGSIEIAERLGARGHEVTVVLASKEKLGQPDYEIDDVLVSPLESKYLARYASRYGLWAGLDIIYYLLPVVWAAWAQAQEF